MREKIFRGKRIDNGKWVFGYYATNTEWDRKTFGEHHFIINCENGIRYEVDPSTVGQYTGLTDKNGKKIFEGDIVKYDDIIGIINYNIGCYCVKTNKPDWKSRTNPAIDIVINEYPNEVEVIGNIHDQPELLKGETK